MGEVFGAVKCNLLNPCGHSCATTFISQMVTSYNRMGLLKYDENITSLSLSLFFSSYFFLFISLSSSLSIYKTYIYYPLLIQLGFENEIWPNWFVTLLLIATNILAKKNMIPPVSIQWNVNQNTNFLFTKMNLKMTSARRRPSCPGGGELLYSSSTVSWSLGLHSKALLCVLKQH